MLLLDFSCISENIRFCMGDWLFFSSEKKKLYWFMWHLNCSCSIIYMEVVSLTIWKYSDRRTCLLALLELEIGMGILQLFSAAYTDFCFALIWVSKVLSQSLRTMVCVWLPTASPVFFLHCWKQRDLENLSQDSDFLCFGTWSCTNAYSLLKLCPPCFGSVLLFAVFIHFPEGTVDSPTPWWLHLRVMMTFCVWFCNLADF